MGTVRRHQVSVTVNSGREIVSIAWYSHRPDWYELSYGDGAFERVPGTQAGAQGLAQTLGMGPPQSRSGSLQWERQGQ
jgi:hypothetical protein